jgi:hypothetical protein
METKDNLDLKGVGILISVTLLWGFHHPANKTLNQGLSPIFASTLRSIVASICRRIYCLRRGEKVFHKVHQPVIIAFITYFAWFKLIHQYSVSSLSAFTFLTPMFRRFLRCPSSSRGVDGFFNHRPPLVSARIFMMNWRRGTALLT